MNNIQMKNPPEGFNVEFWPNYGFTANHRVTTNGSLPYLLSCLRLHDSKEAVMGFAHDIAKTDELAAKMVAKLDQTKEKPHDN